MVTYSLQLCRKKLVNFCKELKNSESHSFKLGTTCIVQKSGMKIWKLTIYNGLQLFFYLACHRSQYTLSRCRSRIVAGPDLIFKVEENGEMGWPAGQGTGCTRWVRWAPVINWQLVHSNGQLLPPAQWIYTTSPHLPCYWYRAGQTRQSHTDLGPKNGRQFFF